MNKSVAYVTLFCLLFLTAMTAYPGSPVAFTGQEVTITINGAVSDGRVFIQTNDSATLLVLSGDAAFLVNKTAKTVYTIAVNRVNDTAEPVMIDYGVLSQIEGAGLIIGADGEVAFLAKGDRYDVRPKDRVYLGP
ncbi:MAG: hypothetical protein JW765_05885 [Deltaproteobacteria bacterium]|nr:hypothetical protein [Candidatus Zymogenaceae bacterium]